MNVPDVTVTVELTGLRGEKIELNPSSLTSSPIKFDISARLEERERKSGEIMVLFALTVGTKPSIVKYELQGKATAVGKDDSIEKMLKVDPQTKFPFVFHKIYQHVFTAIYVLATLMGTMHPPANLLYMDRNIEETRDAESREVQIADTAANEQVDSTEAVS